MPITGKGDYSRAISDFDQAIQLKSDYALAHSSRGNAYAALGDYKRALADYDTAIHLDPGFPGAYFNRGFALSVVGRHTEAAADLSRCVKLSSDPDLRSRAEEILQRLG